METEIILSRGGFPPLSARHCRQKLWTLSLTEMRRTLEGDLIPLKPNRMKYVTCIEGEDENVLATDFIPGEEIIISCLQRLWVTIPKNITMVTLPRASVPGSIFWSEEESFLWEDPRNIRVRACQQERFLSFRPLLSMRVTRYNLFTDEWALKTSWSLELEEI